MPVYEIEGDKKAYREGALLDGAQKEDKFG